jgi:hypothetical protein
VRVHRRTVTARTPGRASRTTRAPRASLGGRRPLARPPPPRTGARRAPGASVVGETSGDDMHAYILHGVDRHSCTGEYAP